MDIEQKDDDHYILDKEMLEKLCNYSQHLHHAINEICEHTKDVSKRDKRYLREIKQTVLLIKRNSDID